MVKVNKPIIDRSIYLVVATSLIHALHLVLYVKKVITITIAIYVTRSGKTGLIHTSTENQFLSIGERYTRALPRNTKYLAIDGQVSLGCQE